VALFLAGFKKEGQNDVFSVGVDIVSCGAGNQDPRISNPGPYRAYLGYGFLLWLG
jgi:hypothetical protein